ncbi:MAG: hypothetical protein Q9191_004942 [Dirinaria sp. TL-2023a]
MDKRADQERAVKLAKEAVAAVGDGQVEVSSDVVDECMHLLLQHQNTLNHALVDGFITGLLRESLRARKYLASRLIESETTTFQQFYELGDGSANALATVVLEPSAWPQEQAREKSEKDVFQLFLAKLMEVGHDHDGKALKGIARLLATDAEKLHGLVDEETFDAILVSLDNRLPIELRSQATMTTAKYLEASKSEGQKYLLSFIQKRVAHQTIEDLILAFSAAAAIFPIAPAMASSFFLIEGFVPSLVPLLEKKIKSERAEGAALDMLSAACIDTACRQAIHKHCTEWLTQVMNSDKEKSKNLAAVVLAKTQAAGDTDEKGKSKVSDEEEDDLVPRLKTMMISAGPATLNSSIEGLAYASTQPKVKEELANDRGFIKRLFDAMKRAQTGSTTIFGALTLINNVTRYLPTIPEEQKKLSQLKAYANAAPSSAEPSPFDSDDLVTKRNAIFVRAGLVPLLVSISKSLSSASKSLLLSILLSLSRNQHNRGTLAQQGAARLLLQTYTSIPGNSDADIQSRFTAAHALARILISVDPTLIFPASGSPPLTSAIRPLLTLLTPPELESAESNSNSPRDLLPTFEGLLALTNLASSPSPSIHEQIIRHATPTLEDLSLHSNPLIQRACTELICNLCTSPPGVKLFATNTPEAKRRLHVLLALADSEDVSTRLAAGGALAGITGGKSSDEEGGEGGAAAGGVANLLAREGGVERVLAMCTDEDQGVRVRGLVCAGHLCSADEGKAALRGTGAETVLKKLIGEAEGKEKEKDVKETAEEVLRVLMG